jgi:hypothetical protein
MKLASLLSVQVEFTPIRYDTNSLSFHATPSLTVSAAQDFRLQLLCSSSLLLLGCYAVYVGSSSRQPPSYLQGSSSPQAVQEFFLDYMTLGDGKDRLPRNRGNHLKLWTVTSQYSECLTSAVNIIRLFLLLYVQIFSSALFLKHNQSSPIPEQVKL